MKTVKTLLINWNDGYAVRAIVGFCKPWEEELKDIVEKFSNHGTLNSVYEEHTHKYGRTTLTKIM